MKLSDRIAPRQPGGKPFLQTVHHIYPPPRRRKRLGRYVTQAVLMLAIGLALAVVLSVALEAINP